MHVLKYNNTQLSIFDFEKARATRQVFLSKLREALSLKDDKDPKKMLEACVANSSVFNVDQRHFIHDMAVMFFDGKEFSDKQERFLSSLYRRCPK
jgi:hypothetical protein